MQRNKQTVLFYTAAIFLLAATFAVYFQVTTHEFVIVDDSIYVTDNKHVQSGLSIENIIWAFSSLKAEFWHPVTWISYMVDYEIYGLDAGGFLLSNLIIHLLNVLLVLYLFRIMTGRTWEPFMIAALFALHPLHVEAVAWVSERKELLCAFFWLSGTVFYVFYTRAPSLKRYIPIVVCFLLGIMSKSMIVTFPFTLLLLDLWPLQRGTLERNGLRRKWMPLVIEKIPLFLITLAGVAVTYAAQAMGDGIVSIAKHSVGSRVANVICAYAAYIKKTFWPKNLSVFYPVREIEPVWVTVSALLLILLTVIFVWRIKKHPFLIVGWLWFLGTLVPVIGIVKIGDFAMADRYTYIPLTGLFVIIVFGIGFFISRTPAGTIWRAVTAIFVLACLAPLAYSQVRVWKDSKTLLEHSISAVEDNFFAHHAMGEIYAGKGEMKRAAVYFARAVDARPDKAVLWVKLGRALFATAAWPKSIHSFEKAREHAPDKWAPHFYLVCAYLAKNRLPEARDYFLKIFDKNSNLVKTFEDDAVQKDRHVFFRTLQTYGIKTDSLEALKPLVIKGHENWETKYTRHSPK